jgi:hypothetical protein
LRTLFAASFDKSAFSPHSDDDYVLSFVGPTIEAVEISSANPDAVRKFSMALSGTQFGQCMEGDDPIAQYTCFV